MVKVTVPPRFSCVVDGVLETVQFGADTWTVRSGARVRASASTVRLHRPRPFYTMGKQRKFTPSPFASVFHHSCHFLSSYALDILHVFPSSFLRSHRRAHCSTMGK